MVACCPVFVGFCFHTLLEQHIHHLAERLLTGGVVASSSTGRGTQSKQIEREGLEHLGERLQNVGSHRCLLVRHRVDGTRGFEQLTDNVRGCEVVVHRLVALLTEIIHKRHIHHRALAVGLTWCDTLQCAVRVEQTLQPLLRRL